MDPLYLLGADVVIKEVDNVHVSVGLGIVNGLVANMVLDICIRSLEQEQLAYFVESIFGCIHQRSFTFITLAIQEYPFAQLGLLVHNLGYGSVVPRYCGKMEWCVAILILNIDIWRI